ncbi:MAG: hypothetical protein K2P84_02090, partial [Undibacterium sp.]|nr:hypothetical protein [Undibacterium sp.]
MTNKNRINWLKSLCGFVVVLQLISAIPVQASVSNISKKPPLARRMVKPNVFFTLDDSGSMQAEVLPDTLTPTEVPDPQGVVKDIYSYLNGSGDCNSSQYWVTRVFPAPDNVYNVNLDGDYGVSHACGKKFAIVVGFGENITVMRWRSSAVNFAYYDPGVRYEPWVDAASITVSNPYGSLMPQASKTAAKYNPMPILGSSTATLDLTAPQESS